MSVESARGFRAGQKKLSAGTLNAMLRTIRELQAGGDSVDLKSLCCQNDTDINLDEYQIVGIGGANQNHADNAVNFLKSIVITGALPTDAYAGKFAVTQEPIKKGQTGRVKIAGVSQCKVNVSDATHTYAKASTAGGVTQLTSSATPVKGCAEILWKESGTGSKWAIIRFPAFADPGALTADQLSGIAPIITSEAGTAGTAATALKSDTKPGLTLRRNGTPAAVSGLEFGTADSGLQISIAGATSEDDERAATANTNPTVEIAPHPGAPGDPNGGLQVKINKSSSPDDLRTLEAQAGGLGVKISATANNQITVSNGLFCRPKLDDLAAPDDNTDLDASSSKHGLLAKLSGNATDYVGGDNACHALPAAGGTFVPLDGVDAGAFTSDGAWNLKDLSGSYGDAKAFLIQFTVDTEDAWLRRDGYTAYQIALYTLGYPSLVVPCDGGKFRYKHGSGNLSGGIFGYWT